MMLDPVAGTLIVASYVILFASAAVHKLRDLPRFAEVFAAYRLLPAALARRLAWAIPVLEAGLALGLLLPGARAFAAGIGSLLLIGYAAAIALNLWRGRRDIACGCGGPDERRPIASWMLWRNLALALLLTGALLPWSARTLLWIDWLTIGGGGAAAIILYRCLDRLGQVARSARALQGLS